MAAALTELRKSHEFLLIADEIQAGLGRTGKLFGFEHYDVSPDVVLVAKPLGGGLPLGAILGTAAVAAVLEPGVHGTTFGGNPVACAAGVAVLHELFEGGVMANAAAMGAHLGARLAALKEEFPRRIKEVRGFGLMAGMELDVPGEPIVAALRERGVLLNCTQQTVLRFLPPLIISRKQLDEGIDALHAVLASAD
jgi:acetylornithine/succinyldiaminopimelate/putrescine aminotransferase